MGTSVEPTLWNSLAETMYLKDSPAAEVALSEFAPFALARIRNRKGLPEIARPTIGESGYLVVLQLRAIPFIQQFLGKKKVSSGFYPTGGVSVIDLRDEPSVLLPNPFDAMMLHLTQPALDEVADAHRAPRVDHLAGRHGIFDPVVNDLGRILVASLENSAHTSRIFVDHVLYALKCHIVTSYHSLIIPSPNSRGGLSPLQIRRATEFLEAHLDGNVILQQVADACGLSVSHFSRAFKQTFHKPPYKWLTERRVDRAKDLMTNSRMPIADIALQSGFADQSALNRSFKQIHGFTPGVWRRRITSETTAEFNSF
jgi:AraC family transcriptional regulator